MFIWRYAILVLRHAYTQLDSTVSTSNTLSLAILRCVFIANPHFCTRCVSLGSASFWPSLTQSSLSSTSCLTMLLSIHRYLYGTFLHSRRLLYPFTTVAFNYLQQLIELSRGFCPVFFVAFWPCFFYSACIKFVVILRWIYLTLFPWSNILCCRCYLFPGFRKFGPYLFI